MALAGRELEDAEITKAQEAVESGAKDLARAAREAATMRQAAGRAKADADQADCDLRNAERAWEARVAEWRALLAKVQP